MAKYSGGKFGSPAPSGGGSGGSSPPAGSLSASPSNRTGTGAGSSTGSGGGVPQIPTPSSPAISGSANYSTSQFGSSTAGSPTVGVGQLGSGSGGRGYPATPTTPASGIYAQQNAPVPFAAGTVAPQTTFTTVISSQARTYESQAKQAMQQGNVQLAAKLQEKYNAEVARKTTFISHDAELQAKRENAMTSPTATNIGQGGSVVRQIPFYTSDNITKTILPESKIVAVFGMSDKMAAKVASQGGGVTTYGQGVQYDDWGNLRPTTGMVRTFTTPQMNASDEARLLGRVKSKYPTTERPTVIVPSKTITESPINFVGMKYASEGNQSGYIPVVPSTVPILSSGRRDLPFSQVGESAYTSNGDFSKFLEGVVGKTESNVASLNTELAALNIERNKIEVARLNLDLTNEKSVADFNIRVNAYTTKAGAYDVKQAEVSKQVDNTKLLIDQYNVKAEKELVYYNKVSAEIQTAKEHNLIKQGYIDVHRTPAQNAALYKSTGDIKYALGRGEHKTEAELHAEAAAFLPTFEKNMKRFENWETNADITYKAGIATLQKPMENKDLIFGNLAKGTAQMYWGGIKGGAARFIQTAYEKPATTAQVITAFLVVPALAQAVLPSAMAIGAVAKIAETSRIAKAAIWTGEKVLGKGIIPSTTRVGLWSGGSTVARLYTGDVYSPTGAKYSIPQMLIQETVAPALFEGIPLAGGKAFEYGNIKLHEYLMPPSQRQAFRDVQAIYKGIQGVKSPYENPSNIGLAEQVKIGNAAPEIQKVLLKEYGSVLFGSVVVPTQTPPNEVMVAKIVGKLIKQEQKSVLGDIAAGLKAKGYSVKGNALLTPEGVPVDVQNTIFSFLGRNPQDIDVFVWNRGRFLKNLETELKDKGYYVKDNLLMSPKGEHAIDVKSFLVQDAAEEGFSPFKINKLYTYQATGDVKQVRLFQQTQFKGEQLSRVHKLETPIIEGGKKYNYAMGVPEERLKDVMDFLKQTEFLLEQGKPTMFGGARIKEARVAFDRFKQSDYVKGMLKQAEEKGIKGNLQRVNVRNRPMPQVSPSSLISSSGSIKSFVSGISGSRSPKSASSSPSSFGSMKSYSKSLSKGSFGSVSPASPSKPSSPSPASPSRPSYPSPSKPSSPSSPSKASPSKSSPSSPARPELPVPLVPFWFGKGDKGGFGKQPEGLGRGLFGATKEYKVIGASAYRKLIAGSTTNALSGKRKKLW